MTLKINLSAMKALPYDFEKEVASLIQAKKDHQKTEGIPAPYGPALVESAVRRVPGSIDPPKADDFVADYEVVDDTPPPPTLDERKGALAMTSQAVAQSIIDKIDPPLKRRLTQMDYANAMAVPEAKRTSPQIAAIAARETRKARVDATMYHLATLESQIHDLTDKTIDGWTPAPFPK